MKKYFLTFCMHAIQLFTFLSFNATSLLASSFEERDNIEVRVLSNPQNINLSVFQRDKDSLATKTLVQGVLNMFHEGVRNLNVGKVTLYPHKLSEDVNAFYTPSENSLTFNATYSHQEQRWIYTCRSVDIVAHETGHLVLAALVDWCRGCRPQTGAFDESFGDLTSILFQMWHPAYFTYAVEDMNKNSVYLGDDIDVKIRNMRAPYKLSNPKSCEVHDLSQPFTSAVFEVIRAGYKHFLKENASQKACKIVAKDLRDILVEGVLKTKSINSPSFADIACKMVDVSHIYGDVLGEEFVKKQILIPLYKQMPSGKELFYEKGPFDKKCDASDQPPKLLLVPIVQSDRREVSQKYSGNFSQLYYTDPYPSNSLECNIL